MSSHTKTILPNSAYHRQREESNGIERGLTVSRKHPLLGNFHIFRERATHDIKRQSPPIWETLDSLEGELVAPINCQHWEITSEEAQEALARRFESSRQRNKVIKL